MPFHDRHKFTALAVVLVLGVCSVAPLLILRGVPGIHHDWYWPLDGRFTWSWISDWLGQWSTKGLGQPNLLPTQTFVILVQGLLVFLAGPAIGLAFFLLICELSAFYGMLQLLKRLGIAGWQAVLPSAVLYAFGPVFFTRVQAGHLSYVVAYALLPLVIAFSVDVTVGRKNRVVVLALLLALSFSQIQFVAFDAVAIGVVVAILRVPPPEVLRLFGAFALALVVQVQGLAPLLLGSSSETYILERPIRLWLMNLSLDPWPALFGVGGSYDYYLMHALPYVLNFFAAILALSLWLGRKKKRAWLLGICFITAGWMLATGMKGPFASVIIPVFSSWTPANVFRDFTYAGVFCSLGISILVAAGVASFKQSIWLMAPLCLYVVLPVLQGLHLQTIFVTEPLRHSIIEEALTIHRAGPGRVLWLPAEEPLKVGESAGRDPAMYTFRDNPSVGDARGLRIISQVDNMFRAGSIPINLLRRTGIKYIVARTEIGDSRLDSLGTTRPLGFGGMGMGSLTARLLDSPHLKLLRSVGSDSIFEVIGTWDEERAAHVKFDVQTYSAIPADTVTELSPGTDVLHFETERLRPDPNLGWQSSFIGAWYAPWINDSVYPYVFTTSRKALRLSNGPEICLLIGSPGGAIVSSGKDTLTVGARVYKSLKIASPVGTFTVSPHGLTALSALNKPCSTNSGETRAHILLDEFDGAWRLWDGRSLRRPVLVDGWAMAWPSSGPVFYLPGLIQSVSLIIDALLLIYVAAGALLNRARGRLIQDAVAMKEGATL